MIHIYYRLSNDIRNLFLEFFQQLFTLYEEGKLSFVDGRNKIVFTMPPKCQDMDTYDFKYYPAVLVGLNPGSFKDTHFKKFRGLDNTLPEAQNIYGGVSDLTITFQISANNREDRNNLSDLVCMYLAKYDTKALFEQKGIRLMTPVFSGDNTEEDPQTNAVRFFTDISLAVQADYEDSTDIVDANGNKVKLANVISLIGDNNPSDGEIDRLTW